MKRIVLPLILLMSLAAGFGAVLDESFESTTFPPEGWTTQPIAWVRSTTDSYTGNASARAGYSTGTWWLITPKLKPIDGANTLSFFYCDYFDSWDEDDEFTYVLVSTSLDFSSAQVVWTGDSDDFTLVWQEAIIDLSEWNDTEIYIAFKHVATFGNYRFIDTVTGVNIAPATDPPNPAILVAPANGVTGIDVVQNLVWASGGGFPDNYDVYLSDNLANLFDVPVVSHHPNTSYSPALHYEKTYYWAVNPYNDNGYAYDDPTEITPWSFTTMDSPILTPPTAEDFSGTFPPPNWTRLTGFLEENSTLTSTTGGWTADGFANDGFTGAARLNIWGSSVRHWLVTPPINLSDSRGDYQLEFDLALTKYGSTEPVDQPCLDDKFAVVISLDNGATWSTANILRQWDMEGSPYQYTAISNTGERVIIALPDTPGLVRIGFYGESTITGNGDNDLFIDNVAINARPSVPIFSVSPESADFGVVELGNTAQRTFNISNIGSGTFTIQLPEITEGEEYFAIISQVSGTDVTAGEPPLSFTVEYSPQEVGEHEGEVTIIDDLSKAVHRITLTGEGYTRPPGSTCENPLPVTLPLVGFTGDTGLYGNDYSSTWVTPSSSYLNGDDMVLQFTLDGPSTLTGTLTGLQGANWIGMHVVDRCPNPSNPAPVLALAVSSSSNTATLSSSAELPAGSYFLILSSWPTPQSYLFSLDFDAIPVVANPELTLKETSWDFGVAKIGDSNCTPHIFTAVNTGNVPVTIGAPPQISSGNFTIIEDNNQYPLVLDVNDEASWTVKFTPTEPCGEKTAQMSFQDDAKNIISLIPATNSDFEISLLKSHNDRSTIGQLDLQSSQHPENQTKEVHSIALRGFGAIETEEDYFEGYDNFALDFPPWTQYDGDESPAYPISDVTFPNSGYTGSFIIFNSPLTTPPITLDSWKAYSGEKMAGCFAAMYSANNDWLMRNFTYSGEARFSFFAKSITAQYGLERMKVLYSFEGCDPEQDYWEYLLGSETSYVTVPVNWTVYEFELPRICPTATVCIAIQCVSDDAFVLFIDDFVIGHCVDCTPVTLSSFSATVTAQNYVQLNWVSQSESQMMGYRVYRNTSNDQAGAILTDHPMIPATNTSEAHSYSLIDTDVEIGNTYYYWLETVDFNSSEFHGPVSVILEGTVPPVLPEITTMGNAYPNPFKSNTNIQIDVKANETGTLSIYNIQGQLVRSYEVREGSHNLFWDSRDNAGNICSSGIYFYRLSTPSFKQTRKFMKIK